MTAPRETGGEGWDATDIARQERAAARYGLTRAEVVNTANVWAHRFEREPHRGTLRQIIEQAMMAMLAYAEHARLATPRPVEVTEGMVRVALDVADRDMREGETFASVLADSLNRQTAALRAQPAGGTEELVRAALVLDEAMHHLPGPGESEATRADYEAVREQFAEAVNNYRENRVPAPVAGAGGTP